MNRQVTIKFDAAPNSVPVKAIATFDPPIDLPEGEVGQYLIKTEDGIAWADMPTPSMVLEAATAETTLTDEGSNAIKAVTEYTEAAGEDDAFVMDAMLIALDTVPAGVKLSITGIAGEYIVAQPQKIFWLSDIIKAHNSLIPTRTKLNGHTGGQAITTFIITISELPSDMVTAITARVVTSNTPGLAGTNQAVMTMDNYIVLAEDQVAVSLAAEAE